MRFNFDRNKECIVNGHSHGFFVSDEMLPVQQHQVYDELLMVEKEFANEVYIQRCLERDL